MREAVCHQVFVIAAKRLSDVAIPTNGPQLFKQQRESLRGKFVPLCRLVPGVKQGWLLVEPVVEPIHVTDGLAAVDAFLFGVPLLHDADDAGVARIGLDLGDAILRATSALGPAGAV